MSALVRAKQLEDRILDLEISLGVETTSAEMAWWAAHRAQTWAKRWKSAAKHTKELKDYVSHLVRAYDGARAENEQLRRENTRLREVMLTLIVNYSKRGDL